MSKVSIVIATFNQLSYLKECLKSCQAQDYSNIELVVTDDCSTDETVKFLTSLSNSASDIKVVLSEKNTGITANLNRGASAATGDWIKFIAGDDRLPANSIACFVDEVRDRPESVFFSDLVTFSDEANSVQVMKQNKRFFSQPLSQKRQVLREKNYPNAPGLFIKRTTLQAVGFFDERFEMMEDYPLWIRLVDAGYDLAHIARPLVEYRANESGVSGGGNKIGNLRFIRSLMKFHKCVLWVELPWWMLFRKLDEWTKLKQKEIGIQYLGNRKSLLYSLLKMLTAPLRIYSPYSKIRKLLCLSIK